MRTFTVLAVAVAIIISCGTAMAAADPDWQLTFSTTINGGGGINSWFGTKTGATDWVGPEDCPPADGSVVIVQNYTKNAFAYTIVNGRVLTNDLRAPITDKTKTWNIWLTATEPGTINLWVYSLTLNPYYNGVIPLVEEPGHPAIVGSYDGGLASLALWHGSDMLWTWKPGQTTARLLNFHYDGSAIALRLVATPTPEPGSLVALLTGLCGLFGFARRRRSRRSP